MLRQALSDTPVVILVGARQCGKPKLVTVLDPERPLFSLDKGGLRDAVTADADQFIQGLPDRVTIDEVQRVPDLLTAIKNSVDKDRKPGRFLLTGSANLLMLPTVTESLAGRMEIARLDTLTEAEKQGSAGRFIKRFLAGLSTAIEPSRVTGTDDTWRTYVIDGEYPEPQTRTTTRARQLHRQYLRGLL